MDEEYERELQRQELQRQEHQAEENRRLLQQYEQTHQDFVIETTRLASAQGVCAQCQIAPPIKDGLCNGCAIANDVPETWTPQPWQPDFLNQAVGEPGSLQDLLPPQPNSDLQRFFESPQDLDRPDELLHSFNEAFPLPGKTPRQDVHRVDEQWRYHGDFEPPRDVTPGEARRIDLVFEAFRSGGRWGDQSEGQRPAAPAKEGAQSPTTEKYWWDRPAAKEAKPSKRKRQFAEFQLNDEARLARIQLGCSQCQAAPASRNGLCSSCWAMNDFAEFIVELPRQAHHLATNKGDLRALVEEALSGYSLSPDDAWNVRVLPHRGRHPYKYHAYVIGTMQAIAEEAGGNSYEFVRLFKERVVEPTLELPQVLRRRYWESD